jgi:thioredoxin reductase (NADPH)
VHTVDSGASALEALNQLKQNHEPVALFLVEQQMPGMTGIEFCEQAIALFPEAKRILLTDVDTDADIRKIKTVNIDCYLLKLSDPPENRLYPTVQDLLDDWQAVFTSPFEGKQNRIKSRISSFAINVHLRGWTLRQMMRRVA